MSTDYEDKLMSDAAKLATEIAPERDLWPGVEAAIAAPEPSTRPRWMPYLAQAAAVILLVGSSSGITYLLTKSETDLVNGAAAVPGIAFDAEFASFAGDYDLGPGFQDARNNLEAELDLDLDRLTPEQRQNVEDNLLLIRNAIAEINEALVRDPDNVLLQELLLRTYREELSVMRKVGGLTKSVMSRNDI